MSFAEFEKEVKLQGKVMAITRVNLADETPQHSLGCIFRMFDRILAGETLVTGLGYCGCKGFESNSGLKDQLKATADSRISCLAFRADSESF